MSESSVVQEIPPPWTPVLLPHSPPEIYWRDGEKRRKETKRKKKKREEKEKKPGDGGQLVWTTQVPTPLGACETHDGQREELWVRRDGRLSGCWLALSE